MFMFLIRGEIGFPKTENICKKRFTENNQGICSPTRTSACVVFQPIQKQQADI